VIATIQIGHQAVDVIDAAGKLGPVIVAALVGWLGWIQWKGNAALGHRQAEISLDAARVAKRQQSIEEQAFRLSMLDARRPVFDRIVAISLDQNHGQSPTGEMRQMAFQAPSEAKFLFPPAVAGAVKKFCDVVFTLSVKYDELTNCSDVEGKQTLLNEIILLESEFDANRTLAIRLVTNEMRVEGNTAPEGVLAVSPQVVDAHSTS
jgi:hypothetical protein